jgi:hypothetical protein
VSDKADFERDVYPRLARAIAARARDAETAAVALVLAWYFWRRDGGAHEPTCYARFALLQARGGRDLPGVKGYTDAFDRLRCWGGAGMDETAEWRPGPLEALVEQERWGSFLSGLTARQRAVLEAALEGRGTGEIATRQGVSAGAVSQLRRRPRRPGRLPAGRSA